MPDLPRYSGEPREPAAPARDQSAVTPTRRRRTVLWPVLVLALVVAFVVLHVTGVLGPRAH